MANQRHHKAPAYTRASRIVRTLANANPRAICWRCGRTLDQHDPGTTRRWSGGHTIDGVNGPPWTNVERRPPAGQPWIAAEVLRCNIVAGNLARQAGSDLDY